MVKGKYTNFVMSSLRKSRGQIAAIALLFVIVSALINIAFCLAFDYKQSFMSEKERLNGEDIDFLYADASFHMSKSDLEEVLAENQDIKAFEVSECRAGKGTVSFQDAIFYNTLSFLRLDDIQDKSIGKYEILESDGGDGIYLSYLFQAEAGYSVGDTVSIQVGNKEASFRIAGFYHNIDTGTVNCSDTAILSADDCFDTLAFGLPSFRVSVQLFDSQKADIVESAVLGAVEENLPALTCVASSSIKKLSSARYTNAKMFEVVILLSAGLMIAVIFATIMITLSSYIRNSIKTLGTMKAIGYTSKMLIVPIVCEFAIIALVMSVLGTFGSYAILPIINNALERQTGIPYKIHFLPLEAVAAVAVCVLTAVITAFLSLLKIRRILPINAIRENRESKKNVHFFALDKTRFGLNTAISLKTWASGWGRNIVLFVAITGVAFLLGFASGLYQFFIYDNQEVLNLICGQMTDSVVSVHPALENDLITELDSNADVERYYMFTISTVTPKDLPKMYAYVVDSTDDIDAKQVCVDGHLPLNDREIAVNGMYANLCGLKIGDTLTFSHNEENTEFIISGITQGAYSSGRDGFLTREGYRRFTDFKDVRYYIDLKDGVDIDGFNSSVGEKINILFSTNFQKSVGSIFQSYMGLLKIATVVMIVLSFSIAVFVLYILISVFLFKKKREHGIFKSLGFVTGDIIYQTVGSLLPTCIVATVAGLWISRQGAASLLTLALHGMGIFSFGSPTKVFFLVIPGIAVLLFITAFSVLLSSSVRKIAPHKLFTNE